MHGTFLPFFCQVWMKQICQTLHFGLNLTFLVLYNVHDICLSFQVNRDMSFAPESAAGDNRPSETKEPDVEIVDPALPYPIIEPTGNTAFKPPLPVAPLQANTTEHAPAPASNQSARNAPTNPVIPSDTFRHILCTSLDPCLLF